MSHKRIFYVRLNLDDFSQAIAGIDSDAEYRQFVDGFLVGAYGHDRREAWPEAKIKGFSVGEDCYKEAQKFSQLQRERVEKRKYRPVNKKQSAVNPWINPGTIHGESTVNPRINREGNPEAIPSNINLKDYPSPSAQDKKRPANGVKSLDPKSILAAYPKETGNAFWRLVSTWAGNKQKVKDALYAYLDAIKTSDPEIIQQAAELFAKNNGKFSTSLDYWLRQNGWLALTGGE